MSHSQFYSILPISIILLVTQHQSDCSEVSLAATVGQTFHATINRDAYFSHLTKEVKFHSNLFDYPDPPRWLKFYQKNISSDAFLYGTPVREESGLKVQITAIDKQTFQMLKSDWTILIKPAKNGTFEYKAVIKVINLDLDEILNDDLPTHFLNRMRKVWSTDVLLTRIESMTDITGRFPVPPTPRASTPKAGVHIEVQGPRIRTSELFQAYSQVQNFTGCPTSDLPGLDLIKQMFAPFYELDWCYFKLVALNTSVRTELRPAILQSSELRPGPTKKLDLAKDFSFAVVFPVVIVTVLAVVLSYIMLGRREGSEDRSRHTSDHQLEQYASIKRSTSTLRSMSTRRSFPLSVQSDSTVASGMTPSRSRDNSVPESKAESHIYPPPAYKLPPTYGEGSEPASPATRSPTTPDGPRVTIPQSGQLVT